MATRTVDPSSPSSCARAATAAEARFRINRPIAPARAPRVIALDAGAERLVRRVAGRSSWANARFYVSEGTTAPGVPLLREVDGGPATLADELASADVVVMVATNDDGADSAYSIGKACWQRSVMTAGLVVPDPDGDPDGGDGAVAALRPHARVLLPGADESDVVELLTALRA